eukprot:gene34753-40820_t
MGSHLTLTASDGHSFDAYRADPTGTPRGGIVVVQEIFGVNSHIRSMVDRFAALGYIAIAPALFDRIERGYESGYSAEERPKAFSFVSNPPIEAWLKDIAACRDAIATEAGKVAITGYCLGGSLSYLTAARLDGFVAASCYYGGFIAKVADEAPKIPTQAHFGEKDAHIGPDQVATVRAKQPSVEVYTYPGDHAFNRDPDPNAFDAFSAQVAFGRTLRLFDSVM